MMVGMFDGMSFKKIKRAKIGGESFRDKLTAVWFELMDFAGKCNHNGAFVSPSEIPFTDLSDIAIMIDRDEEELKLCMAFFIKEGMITVIDDVYSLSNWAEYQNIEGMEKIRESKRLAQARWRAKQKALPQPPAEEPTVEPSVESTVDSTRFNVDDAEEDKDKESEKESERDIKISSDLQSVVDLYHSICISYPKIRSLSDARKKTIKARLKSYSMDDFKTLFENAEASSFLKGTEGGWKASFDWLIKESNMLKVLEGNYTDKPKTYGYRYKEKTPGWMGFTAGEAEVEAIHRIMNDESLKKWAEENPIENDPDFKAEQEQLRRELQASFGR